jgi:hypothetical protein
VARAPADAPTEAGRWRYWDGARWQRDPARAVELIGERDGVSQTLSVFSRSGRWFAVSKRNEFVGTDLVIWTSPSPTGPYVPHDTSVRLPSDAATGLLRYMPLAHPDLLPEEGTIVVSYSQNTTDLGQLQEDPTLYRPRFLRVPLP